MMPPDLPKSLLLRRAIDHKIEMILGIVPPSRPSYCLSPLELDKLRKQLNELLEVGLVQPSKAPANAPLLFRGNKMAS